MLFFTTGGSNDYGKLQRYLSPNSLSSAPERLPDIMFDLDRQNLAQ